MIEERDDVIAGRNPVLEALRSNMQISRILVSDGKKEGTINAIIAIARKNNVLVKEVAKAKLDGIISEGNHQGVIAFISPIKYVEVDDLLENAKQLNEDPFIVILDGIEDVHNLGAIARTALAAGAHGMIIPKHRAAPITPTAMKASAGALTYLQVSMVTNISNTIEYLQGKGLWTVGTHQDAKDLYYQIDLKGPLAVIIGGEDKGIGPLIASKCDFMVSIPMKGKVSSLNASASAAVVIFEAARQRLKK
ncbi:MAG: 23S rRNA (guanosine(2251)-2'-O)-methyltransferase RlmB [Clostridia bacterium]|nr:23S rRNA (guanosine(2251)-2'-O)-methyltransferase RlmB [Clostridia bacterium]